MKLYLSIILVLTFAFAAFAQENKRVPIPTDAKPLPESTPVYTQKVIVEKMNGEQLTGDFLGGNIATVTLRVSGKKTSVRCDEIKLIRFDGKSDSGTTASAAAEQTESVKTIAAGVLNGKAIKLGQPITPPAALAVRASGTVNIQIIIDTDGSVTSAMAISGHPLLRQAAEKAARESRFSPTTLSGKPVKLSGVLIFNFVAQ